MAGRLRQVPVTKTTQKLSSKLIKYGAVGIGLISIIVTCMIIYSNFGISHDTLAGSSTTSSYAGSALKFNGTSDYVSIGKVKGQFNNAFTAMAWVKWDIDPSKGNASASIFTINSTGTADQGIFWLQHSSDNSKFVFGVQTDVARYLIQGTTTVQKGVWYHVAGVYDGTNLSLFVNGSKEGKTTTSGTIPKVGTDYEINIGESAYSSSNYRRFTGVIDEVSAWDNALSESNVRKYMATKVPDKQSGIIMNFNFDEGIGTKLTDASSPYSGTVTGATWVTSGAPVSPENSYQLKNGTKNYTYTFKNGYSVQITNLSQDPSAVLFYYIESTSTLKSNFSKYDFNYGILGFYVINSSAVTYTVKYTNPSLAPGAKSLAVSSGFMVASQSASDATWSSQTVAASDSKSSFSITPTSPRLETAVGDLTVAMPIVLEYFKGSSTQKNAVLLEWATVSEQNNDYFSVERSGDGKTFEVIKKISGAGNSTKKLYYDYTDDSPLPGANYYRLKQTDYDSKFEYSKTIAVTVQGGTGEIEYEVKGVYPNPFVDDLTIQIITGSESTITIKLLNSKGAVFREESFTPVVGENEFQLKDNAALDKGLYILSISQAGQQPKAIRVAKN